MALRIHAFNTSCVERLEALLTLVLIPSGDTKLITPSTRGPALILAWLEVLSVDAQKYEPVEVNDGGHNYDE
jgi:hypothetical protein